MMMIDQKFLQGWWNDDFARFLGLGLEGDLKTRAGVGVELELELDLELRPMSELGKGLDDVMLGRC
jgi:hypothetical protein